MEDRDARVDSIKRWPWFVTIGFGILMAMSAGVFSVIGDPEATFWRRVLMKKREIVAYQRDGIEGHPMIFVGGGSSCSFSIHPDVLEDVTGLRAVNVGGAAAMGYRYLTWLATTSAKEGDIVILHLEPDILRGSEKKASPLTAKVDLLGALTEPGAGAFVGEIFEKPADRLVALRPGAKLIGTLASKWASGRPLFQYRFADLQGSGVLTTKVSEPNRDVEAFAPMVHWLDDEVMADLCSLADYAKRRKIRIFYTLPWECFTEEALKMQRLEHSHYLEKISSCLPVLSDVNLGAVSDNALFLDTGYHMTLEGGRIRSRMLGDALNRELSNSP